MTDFIASDNLIASMSFKLTANMVVIVISKAFQIMTHSSVNFTGRDSRTAEWAV